MKNLSLDHTAAHPSALHAALHAKCPKCREGNMFANNLYSLSGQKMNKTCPECGYTFEIEPGYFYVAMFVSYAMNVAEMVTVAVAAYIFGLKLEYDNLWYYIILLFSVSVVLSPLNYRYSRMILLYWLSPGLHYEPERSA